MCIAWAWAGQRLVSVWVRLEGRMQDGTAFGTRATHVHVQSQAGKATHPSETWLTLSAAVDTSQNATLQLAEPEAWPQQSHLHPNTPHSPPPCHPV